MESRRADLTARSLEADFRREEDPDEAPRHFINLELYDPSMLADPSLDLRGLRDRLGAGRLRRYGVVPWAAAESFARLVEAFRQRDRAMIFRQAGDLAHYLADLHQPLHTTENFDGQRSGQPGIHSRFEGRLLELFIGSIPVLEGSPTDPGPLLPALHRMVRESFERVPLLLEADRRVLEELPAEFRGSLSQRRLSPREFPDRYYALMFSRVESLLSGRLNAASRRLASLWWTAWREAGEPVF